MKKIILLFTILTLLSCNKETTILPEEIALTAEQLEEQHDNYFKILTSNEAGWFFNVAGSESRDSVMLHLVFKSDGKVIMKSSRRENLTNQESSFNIDGKYKSILNFEDNSILTLLKSINHTSMNYVVEKYNNDVFYLKRGDGYNNNLLTLSPYNVTLNANFQAKQDSVRDLLAYESAFAITKGLFYQMLDDNKSNDQNYKRFNVFSYGEYGFHWTQVDTITNKIMFEFVPPYSPINTTYKKTYQTYEYTFFPGGMKFTPSITFGNLVIDSIKFNSYDPANKKLIISKAGNLSDFNYNEASFGYSNQEAHYYEGILTLFNINYFTASPARMFPVNSTSGVAAPSFKGRFNKILNEARRHILNNEILADNININFNIRVNNSGSGGGTMLQMYIAGTGRGNIFYKFDFVSSGKNRVKLANFATTTNGTANAFYNNAAVRQMMIDIFGGEDGFYISPTNGASEVDNTRFYLLDPNHANDYIVLGLNISNTAEQSETPGTLAHYYNQYSK